MRMFGKALHEYPAPQPPPGRQAAGISRRIYYIRYPMKRGEGVFLDTVRVTECGGVARLEKDHHCDLEITKCTTTLSTRSDLVTTLDLQG
jgi:hypothetical protein